MISVSLNPPINLFFQRITTKKLHIFQGQIFQLNILVRLIWNPVYLVSNIFVLIISANKFSLPVDHTYKEAHQGDTHLKMRRQNLQELQRAKIIMDY